MLSPLLIPDLLGPPPVEDEDDDIFVGSKGKFVSKGLFDVYDRCYLPCYFQICLGHPQ